MSTVSKGDIRSIAGAAFVGLVSVVSTYYITNLIRDLKDQQKRLESNEARLSAKEKSLSAQKANKEPAGTVIDDVVINKVFLWEVEHLGHYFDAESPSLFNTMKTGGLNPRSSIGGVKMLSDPESKTEYNRLISSHECVLADLVRKPEDGKTHTRAYVRAGPRKVLHFDPATTNAAVVTCGGLCPGLNNVVREITKTLCQLYSIGGKVYGIRGGYRGFYDPELEPLILTPELVEDIHHDGGTFLGSSRGGFDLEKITKFISDKKIKTLFVIGGDGTHRGAFAIHEGCMKKVSN